MHSTGRCRSPFGCCKIGCSGCNLVSVGHLLPPVATCDHGKYFQLVLKTTSRHQSDCRTKYGRLIQVAHHHFLQQLRVSGKTIFPPFLTIFQNKPFFIIVDVVRLQCAAFLHHLRGVQRTTAVLLFAQHVGGMMHNSPQSFAFYFSNANEIHELWVESRADCARPGAPEPC